jgi:hypothetical protein
MDLKERSKEQAAMRKNRDRAAGHNPAGSPVSPKSRGPARNLGQKLSCLMCDGPSHFFKECPKLPQGILREEMQTLMRARQIKDDSAMRERRTEEIMERVHRRLAAALAGRDSRYPLPPFATS